MPAPLELAEAFIHAGELDDALAAIDQHLQAQPQDAAARRLRASVRMRLPGRERDALADLDALPSLTADDHLWRAHLLNTLGEHEAAVAAIRQAWQLRPDPYSAELLLRQLYRRGEVAAALDLLTHLPKTWKWLGWSADVYALNGSHVLAIQHYGSALDHLAQMDRNPLLEAQRAHLLLKRAEVYRRLERFDDADADYLAAETIIPNDPLISFNRGLLLFEQGDLHRALPLCRAALDRAPDALRQIIRNLLLEDPRYHLLSQALLS